MSEMQPYTYSNRDRDWQTHQGAAPHDTAPMPRLDYTHETPPTPATPLDPQMDYEEFFYGEGTEMPKERRGGGCCSIVFAVLACLALVSMFIPFEPVNLDVLRGTSIHHFETWLSDTFGIELPEPAQEQLEAIYDQDAQAEDGYFKAEPPTNIETTDEAAQYYRRALSAHAARVYDDVFEGLQNMDERITLPLFTSAEEVEAVWSLVLYDHPEIFYLADDARVTYWEWAGNVTTLEPDYKYSQETVAQLNDDYETLARELPLLGSSQEETMENICVYVADTTEYVNSDNDQFIDSVFSNHESVCAGYAKAVQYLALRHGIPCVYITGTAEDYLNTGGNHAWLAAFIDGQVRYYDPTWFDQRGWHADQFLGMNLVEISADHTADYPQLLPR